MATDSYPANNSYRAFKSGSFVAGNWLSGPKIAFDDNGSVDQVRIENSYVSGTPFTTSGTLPGDFSRLGFTTTFVMSFTGTGAWVGTQTFTFNFRGAATVPLPATLPLVPGGSDPTTDTAAVAASILSNWSLRESVP